MKRLPKRSQRARPVSLVTGGAGFIGRHVAAECLAMGHRVVVLDDLSGGFRSNVPAGTTFVRGSILDRKLLARLFSRHRFDYVYHLAAYAAEGLSHFIRRYNYDINVLGSMNLINECVRHRVRCLVFTSSIAVYGPGQLPMREDQTPEPEDPYGIAKYAVELDLRAARRLFGLDFIVFRPHNVYGEHQNLADPHRNVVGIFIRQALQGKPLTLFGDGRQTRAFSHVDDVAPHIARSVLNPRARGRVFNIGAGRPVQIRELAKLIEENLGRKIRRKHLPARQEVQHAYASHRLAEKLLGAKPKIPIGEGLERMVRWAKQTRIPAPKKFQGLELKQGLPDIWKTSTR